MSSPKPVNPSTASGSRATRSPGRAEQEHHQPEGGTADQCPQQRVGVERLRGPSGDRVEQARAEGPHWFVDERLERAVRIGNEVGDEADASTDEGVEAGPVVVRLVEEEVGPTQAATVSATARATWSDVCAMLRGPT